VDSQLRSTLVKVALPLLVIALTLVGFIVHSKKKRCSLKDLGLAWPKPQALFLWLALWIAWMAVSEIAINALGMEQAKRWPDYSPLVIGLRIVAIGILGPAAEELLVRGLLFSILSRKWPGPLGAILICAAGWAAMHYRYDWKTVTLVFLDGIILGGARYRSGSVCVPILMHVLGNVCSIYQSLHA
jgi:membrane protease YdiL (CAAX protease family)